MIFPNWFFRNQVQINRGYSTSAYVIYEWSLDNYVKPIGLVCPTINMQLCICKIQKKYNVFCQFHTGTYATGCFVAFLGDISSFKTPRYIEKGLLLFIDQVAAEFFGQYCRIIKKGSCKVLGFYSWYNLVASTYFIVRVNIY